MVKRIIYPPVWLVIGLISIFALSKYWPVQFFGALVWQLLGSAIIVVGLYLLVVAAGLFRKAETDLVPFKNVTSLVTSGIYQYTRNPMYLGMFAVLLGCCFTVGVLSAFIVPLAFVVIIEVRFIRPEEAMLRELFPEEFPEYCEKVRRWL